MEFGKELLEKLERDGISWSREEDGSLVYVAAYEHASAVVDPVKETFKVVNECCPAEETGVICDRSFSVRYDGESPAAERVLRDIAEACGRIDQAMEDALSALEDYDISEY